MVFRYLHFKKASMIDSDHHHQTEHAYIRDVYMVFLIEMGDGRLAHSAKNLKHPFRTFSPHFSVEGRTFWGICDKSPKHTEKWKPHLPP